MFCVEEDKFTSFLLKFYSKIELSHFLLLLVKHIRQMGILSFSTRFQIQIRPRAYGMFNYTAAQVTYYVDDETEPHVGYTNSPGEGGKFCFAHRNFMTFF